MVAWKIFEKTSPNMGTLYLYHSTSWTIISSVEFIVICHYLMLSWYTLLKLCYAIVKVYPFHLLNTKHFYFLLFLGMTIMACSFIEPVFFVADHPFFFTLLDKDQTLFAGRLNEVWNE